MDDFLQQRRHARRRQRRWRTGWGSAGTQAFGIFLFILGIKAAEDGAGFRIGQIDRAQVPRSVTNPEFLQVAEPEGTSKRMASRLSVPSLRRWMRRTSVVKASCSLAVGGQGWARSVVKKTGQRSLACLGMNLTVVFQLDPSQGRLVELLQSQIGDAFEHGQKAALDLAPKRLLLTILIRAKWKCVFIEDSQPSESLFGFGSDHGGAVVKNK